MPLTKYEKETIILFNEGEDTAHIQTYNAGCGSGWLHSARNTPTFAAWRNPSPRAA